MSDHVHEWIMMEPNDLFEVAKCKHCPEKLHADDAEAVLNNVEKLLHAIAHSPLYWNVKDTYTELRDIVDALAEEE